MHNIHSNLKHQLKATEKYRLSMKPLQKSHQKVIMKLHKKDKKNQLQDLEFLQENFVFIR
jgi:hypothetical protein